MGLVDTGCSKMTSEFKGLVVTRNRMVGRKGFCLGMNISGPSWMENFDAYSVSEVMRLPGI